MTLIIGILLIRFMSMTCVAMCWIISNNVDLQVQYIPFD